MKKKLTLEDIFKNDSLGLLEVKSKDSQAQTPEERLVASFEEITKFVTENNREPETDGSIQEHQLASRLKKMRADKQKRELLAPYDTLNLLGKIEKEISSVDDIIESDELGLLDETDESLFELKNVPKVTTMPDYIAKRKPCKDFESFDYLFTQCQKDLQSGKRKLVKFENEQEIESGFFFVLKGILLYVANKGKLTEQNGKYNARLRCIFENGTESNMLLRSLSAELYKAGKRVTEHEDRLLDNFKGISSEDRNTGYIYVLKSLSTDEKIRNIENLYKIGYSTGPVEQRIMNAEEEPTYLMAPVKIVTTFECYNFNPQKLEKLLHTFFGAACLNVDIHDAQGKRYTPREWFIAPLDIIEKAIALIISGGVVNYRYDHIKEEIILR